MIHYYFLSLIHLHFTLDKKCLVPMFPFCLIPVFLLFRLALDILLYITIQQLQLLPNDAVLILLGPIFRYVN